MKKILLFLVLTSLNLVAQTPIWHYTFDGIHTPVDGQGVAGPALLRLSGGIPTTANYGMDRFGNPGNSLICNDSNANFVYETNLPNLPQGTAVRSFSFWVRYKSTAEQHIFKYGSNSMTNIFGLIKDGNPNSTNTFTATASNQYQYFTHPNYPTYLSLNSNDSDAWFHYVVVVDSNLLCRIYRNGILLGSHGMATSLNTIGTVLRFGAYDMTSMNTVNVDFNLDDFKVYDVALTQTQIREMYVNETPYNGTDLVAYYGFENNLDCTNNPMYNLTAENPNVNNYSGGVIGQSRRLQYNPVYNNVIGADINNSSFTIMAWDRLNEMNIPVSDYATIVEYGGSVYARRRNTNLYMGYAATASEFTEKSTFLAPAGVWEHHTLTVKMIGSTFHLEYYRNGELYSVTDAPVASVSSVHTFYDKFFLGGGIDGSGNSMGVKKVRDINIDEVYVYNRVLSQPEILATMYRTTLPAVLSNSNFELKEISLYPNPTNSIFTVEVPNDTVKTISVVDIMGKVIVNSNVATVDVSSLASGVYIVKVETTSGKVGTQKLVKN